MTIAELSMRDEAFENALLPVLIGSGIAVVALLIGTCVTRRQSAKTMSRRVVCWLIYLGFLCSVAVLAATSFGSIIDHGHMAGYALMAHTAAAGGFVFLLLAVAIVFLPRPAVQSTNESRWWFARASSWTLVSSGIVVSTTMFASMLPIFATPELIEAVRWHRWAGLVCVVAAVLHVASIACVRLKWR